MDQIRIDRAEQDLEPHLARYNETLVARFGASYRDSDMYTTMVKEVANGRMALNALRDRLGL